MAIQLIGSLSSLNQSAGLASQSQQYLGRSMIELGGELSKTIAERAAYRDAEKAAPFIQQSFLSAYDDIAKGDISGGIGKAVGTAAQYGTNPILARITTEGVRAAGLMTNSVIEKMDVASRENMLFAGMDEKNRQAISLLDQEEAELTRGLGLTKDPRQKDMLEQGIKEIRQQKAAIGQGAKHPRTTSQMGEIPFGPKGYTEPPLPVADTSGNSDLPPPTPQPQSSANTLPSQAFSSPDRNNVAQEIGGYIAEQNFNKLSDQDRKKVSDAYESLTDEEKVVADAERDRIRAMPPEDQISSQAPAQYAAEPMTPLLRSEQTIRAVGGIPMLVGKDGTQSKLTVTRGSKGTEFSLTTEDGKAAEIPKDTQDALTKIAALQPTIPTDINDQAASLGGFGNLRTEVTGDKENGYDLKFKVRVPAGEGKTQELTMDYIERDERGIPTKKKLNEETANAIKGVSSSLEVVKNTSLPNGMRVAFKPTEGAQETVLNQESAIAATIPKRMPFGLSAKDTLEAAGINYESAKSNGTEKALLVKAYGLVDNMAQEGAFDGKTPAQQQSAYLEKIRELSLDEKESLYRFNQLATKEKKTESKAIAATQEFLESAVGKEEAEKIVKSKTDLQRAWDATVGGLSAAAGAVAKEWGKLSESDKVIQQYSASRAAVLNMNRERPMTPSKLKETLKKLDEQRDIEMKRING